MNQGQLWWVQGIIIICPDSSPAERVHLTDLKKEMASEHHKKPFESNLQASRIEEDSKTSL